MKNQEVISEWNAGREAKTKHLFSERNGASFVLYSYGYHFPLVVYFSDGLIINKSGYSNTTAQHQGKLARVLGYSNFKDLLARGGDNNIIFMTTEELREVLRGNYENRSAIIERHV